MKKDSVSKKFSGNFIIIIAEGRKMKESDVDSVGRGKVWTGSQGKKNGLVDELGGFNLAIEIAKAKAKIDKDADVKFVSYPERKEGFPMFGEMQVLSKILSFNKIQDSRYRMQDVEEFSPEFVEILKILDKVKIYESNDILMIMPEEIEIK
jgi:ClpP class serine protease